MNVADAADAADTADATDRSRPDDDRWDVSSLKSSGSRRRLDPDER